MIPPTTRSLFIVSALVLAPVLAAGLARVSGAWAQPSLIEITPPTWSVRASTGSSTGSVGGAGPASVVDGNLSTRWTVNGAGHWLMLDLQTSRALGAIDVTFGHPDQRQSRFDLWVAAEGGNWQTAFSGQSTGLTTERFAITTSAVRFVLLIANGTNIDAFNSVAELRIFAQHDGGGVGGAAGSSPDASANGGNGGGGGGGADASVAGATGTGGAGGTGAGGAVINTGGSGGGAGTGGSQSGTGGTGPCVVPSGTSALWKNFVEARSRGAEPTLPDFSFAGYRRSEANIPNVTGPLFPVTRYGAVANDDAFDDAGIQAAINAAKAAGGGVVTFPKGRFLVNPTEGSSPITITGSRIVLRGAGAGANGTDVVMVSKKSGGRMFHVGPSGGWGATRVANVIANARRETFTITVDDASKLRPGQIVVLKHQSPQYNAFYYAGLPLDPDWTRVVQGGVPVHEMHEIADVSGAVVRFKEPLHFTIRLDDVPWRLERVNPLSEIGIEDLRFSGSWDSYPETFVHHKDWIHDSGWSLWSFRETVNAWVRRVEFRNFNDALGTDSVGWMTIEDVRFTGKKGHSSIGGRRGYGMLVKDAVDTAGTHHGPDTGYQLVGAVYLRFTMNVNASVDNHGGVPHANLLDDVQGGVLSGNGGPLVNYPHTGRYYTLWNFRHRASGSKTYDFWNATARNSHTFALPIFAGFTHDRPVTFQSIVTEIEANESFGTRVTPTSLFEAQLALRRCR